jgi:two-component system response regulator FixJ
MSKNKATVGSPSRCLVVAVDDDPRVRESLKSLFDSARINARIFASGAEALAFLIQGTVGCLVTDVRMPKMDGWELQRQAHAIRPEVPVIFVTAHQDYQAYNRATSLGAFAFIYKPFDPEELLQAVVAALERGSNPKD